MRIGTKLISLNALYTFEFVGRHEHMGRAAEELNVTQSAVSHQIRSLEIALDVKLFDRKGRGLILTGDGQKLLSTVQHALHQIMTTGLQLGHDVFAGELAIAASASFSTQWLMPRLSTFLRDYPDLTLRRSVVPAGSQAGMADVDVAIVFDDHKFPGRRVSSLVDLEVFPVCAPSLVSDTNSVDPSHLETQTLIHEDDGRLWSRWFAVTGVKQIQPRRHVYAGTHHDAIGLARTGVGFAITDKFMGSINLKSGALVQPFGSTIAKYGRYYLVTPASEEMSEPAIEFERWLRREVMS